MIKTVDIRAVDMRGFPVCYSILCAAQERLEKLTHELDMTQEQITQAGQELQKMAATASPGNQLTEDDKQAIRDRLAHKISKVRIFKPKMRYKSHQPFTKSNCQNTLRL